MGARAADYRVRATAVAASDRRHHRAISLGCPNHPKGLIVISEILVIRGKAMGSEKKSRKRRSSPSSSSENDSRRSRKHSKRDDEKERKITKDGDKERKRKSNHKSHEHSGSREARGWFKFLDSLIEIFIQGNTSFSSRSSQAIPKILLFGTFFREENEGEA
ncbi:hypothetical protein KSP39_PZI020449 [Platanthera zijinensis]|uniref:Uncharacterized protein n=1 Tax=Platanthera zijinensis TaxID=2320716 RepID=A0AAP0AZM8_9ASPA